MIVKLYKTILNITIHKLNYNNSNNNNKTNKMLNNKIIITTITVIMMMTITIILIKSIITINSMKSSKRKCIEMNMKNNLLGIIIKNKYQSLICLKIIQMRNVKIENNNN